MKKSSTCANEAEARLSSLLPKEIASVAVACSGGSDSMALALLVQDWAQKHGIKMVAITVDHGLRKESKREALQVGKWLQARSIPHAVLTWKGTKPKSNIQEAARRERYGLMTEYCKKHKISHLLVAHTLDDQAETFLLRLRRGSGVDGLAAMSEVTEMEGISLVRPLLHIRKTALIEYLNHKKQDFIHDPSNDNLLYDRVKIRRLIPLLEESGISTERLAATASNMARARKYLKKKTASYLKKHGEFSELGYAILDDLPASEELALRVLAQLLMAIGGQEVTPRLDTLMELHKKLLLPAFKGATACGCKIQRTKKNTFLFFREVNAAISGKFPIHPGDTLQWDNRFEITLQSTDKPLYIAPLMQKGWLTIAKESGLESPCPDKQILYTLPAFCSRNGKILAVPHLHFGSQTIKARVKLLKSIIPLT